MLNQPVSGLPLPRQRIADEDGANDVRAGIAAREAAAVPAVAAGEVEVVRRGQDDVGPVAGDEAFSPESCQPSSAGADRQIVEEPRPPPGRSHE